MTSHTMADNRRRSPRKGITEVLTSSVHGRGLFASRNIAAGQHVGVYEGRRHGTDAKRKWDPRLVYVFRLSDGTVIDGSEGGNESRHINHSPDSNRS